MTSLINSTGTSTGLQLVSDASGALALQVGGVNVMSFSTTGILTGMTAQSVASYLAGAVTITNANQFYNGPNTGSIGAAGQTWLILAKGEIGNAGSAVAGEIAIWDGSNYVAGSANVGGAASWPSVGIAAYFTTLTGPTTFTLRAAANAANSYLTAASAFYSVPKSCWIIAVRLA